MTYTVHYKSAKYGLDDQINQEFQNESDRDAFVEKLASEISKLGLTWVPECSEVIGPIDLDVGMDDSEFAEWFDATANRLWEEYWGY
nr:MAG TPA: ESCRT-I subunit Mvb12 [Caudoviricetes sp.]